MNRLAPATTTRKNASDCCLATITSVTENRFRASGYLALRSVSCIARDGVVHLHGCLPSYYLKQIAQEIAAAVDGVSLVVNKIDVKGSARGIRASQMNDAF